MCERYLRCGRCREQFEELIVFDGEDLCETCKAIAMSEKSKEDLNWSERNEYFHIRTMDLGKIAKEILEKLDELQTRCGLNHKIAESAIVEIILKNEKKLGE